MAKNQILSGYQKGIVKRYYDNIEDLSMQSINETISNLYLETKPLKKLQMWTKLENAFSKMSLSDDNKTAIEKALKARDINKVCLFAEKIF